MNENKHADECKESTQELHRYSRMTRYVLLNSLACYTTSKKLHSFLEKLMYHELDYITEVVNILLRIFRADFDKIIDIGNSPDSEIEYAQFLLSRCKLLCLEPTCSSFFLACAFLCNLILRNGEIIECFRILYICEFCFLVLHRRLFWKIFNSKDDYWKLQKFCDEFCKSFTMDSTLSELQKTTVGANWINNLKGCVDATQVNFYLDFVDLKLFEDDYSKVNRMECKWDHLREIENMLFPRCESRIESFCNYCESKCYKYLAHANQFKF
ncbi:hypothetical protein TNCT_255201 [Trichonephila clavata]|uniref:Uncharacterized protein n=1 Tax=Trichonephila clavata TaxID=2740835 RepID=A0A8X6HTU4_TRICU|nr:hypothetical protein TNCT_255201 [Trichonephila clavata]